MKIPEKLHHVFDVHSMEIPSVEETATACLTCGKCSVHELHYMTKWPSLSSEELKQIKGDILGVLSGQPAEDDG